MQTPRSAGAASLLIQLRFSDFQATHTGEIFSTRR
jgi:hypothetical protein